MLKITDPYIHLYIKSMGKVFCVEAICHTTEEANEICLKNRTLAVMAEDKAGHIYICRTLAAVCDSEDIYE